MTDREQVERQIEELLTLDTDSVTLSNRLFEQGSGLFSRLGPTLEDRKMVVASDLWRRARARLRELEERDLGRFRAVVRTVEEQWPNAGLAVKLEPVR